MANVLTKQIMNHIVQKCAKEFPDAAHSTNLPLTGSSNAHLTDRQAALLSDLLNKKGQTDSETAGKATSAYGRSASVQNFSARSGSARDVSDRNKSALSGSAQRESTHVSYGQALTKAKSGTAVQGRAVPLDELIGRLK
jgi:hypothetical protein